MRNRKPYPSDVSDEEWAFAAPYLVLVREDAPQCNHDLPPWEAIYQQTQRWPSDRGVRGHGARHTSFAAARRGQVLEGDYPLPQAIHCS